MADTIEVSLAVVTFNSADKLPAFLSALPDALTGVDGWELIIADSSSTDDTVAIASERASWATIVALPENRGFAAGVNAAVAAAAPGAPVLVLNDDVRLGTGSVRALLDQAGRPGVGITVPKILDGHGSVVPSLRRDPSVRRALCEAVLGGRRAAQLGRGELVVGGRAYDTEHDVDWASGATMLLTRPCLDEVGELDESYFLYSEETDFALRARDAGFTIRYVPTAEVVHLGGESGSSPRLWTMLTLNRVRLFRRRHGAVHGLAFAGAVVLNELLRSAGGRPTHRAALSALLRPAHRPPELQGEPGWIAYSAQDWWYHNQAHSDFQLLRRVAQQRTVLVVNSIGMRMPLPGRTTQTGRRMALKLRSIAKLVRRPLADTRGFHVFTPLTIPFYSSPVGRRVNTALIRAQVAVAARWVRVGPQPVLFVTIPTAWGVVREQPRRALVVNRSDKHSAFAETAQDYIRQLEVQLLEHADHVLYVSRSLMSDELPHAGDRAVFLDHGVDLTHFSSKVPAQEPADLRSIPHPRIGFFGGLEEYLVDFDLLERLAADLPEVQLVLIGDATCSMERFGHYDNAHWLGFRAYEDIPSYGSGFDVALMPWHDNDWVRHSNPIKLKEYLALGLPVVSTDFPEVRHYERWVAIAGNADDFVAAVRDALAGRGRSTPSERRRAVADASWDRRAATLLELAEGRIAARPAVTERRDPAGER